MNETPERIGSYSGEQIANATSIMAATADFGLGPIAMKLAVMCAMGESSLKNITYGDWETGGVTNPDGSPTTSIGLFQQQRGWGSVEERMDPVFATRAFLTKLKTISRWWELEPTLAIHKVQVNADPQHYAKYEGSATLVVEGILDYQIAKARETDMGLYTLRPGLTLQWEAAVAWALAERELGYKLGVNRSLADYATQMRLYLDYTSGRSKIIALHPDASNHVKGLAVDSDNQSAREVEVLANHGFIRTVYRNGVLVEPWHYDYIAGRDLSRGAGMPAGASTGETYFNEGDDDMSAEDVVAIQKNTDAAGASIVKQVLDALPGLVWGFGIQYQNDKGILQTKDGKPVVFPASGFLAAINGSVGKPSIAMTDAQIAQLAGQIKTTVAATITEAYKTNQEALLSALDDIPEDVADIMAARLAARK